MGGALRAPRRVTSVREAGWSDSCSAGNREAVVHGRMAAARRIDVARPNRRCV